MPANGATLRALHFFGSAAPMVEWLLKAQPQSQQRRALKQKQGAWSRTQQASACTRSAAAGPDSTLHRRRTVDIGVEIALWRTTVRAELARQRCVRLAERARLQQRTIRGWSVSLSAERERYGCRRVAIKTVSEGNGGDRSSPGTRRTRIGRLRPNGCRRGR